MQAQLGAQHHTAPAKRTAGVDSDPRWQDTSDSQTGLPGDADLQQVFHPRRLPILLSLRDSLTVPVGRAGWGKGSKTQCGSAEVRGGLLW